MQSQANSEVKEICTSDSSVADACLLSMKLVASRQKCEEAANAVTLDVRPDSATERAAHARPEDQRELREWERTVAIADSLFLASVSAVILGRVFGAARAPFSQKPVST